MVASSGFSCNFCAGAASAFLAGAGVSGLEAAEAGVVAAVATGAATGAILTAIGEALAILMTGSVTGSAYTSVTGNSLATVITGVLL